MRHKANAHSHSYNILFDVTITPTIQSHPKQNRMQSKKSKCKLNMLTRNNSKWQMDQNERERINEKIVAQPTMAISASFFCVMCLPLTKASVQTMKNNNTKTSAIHFATTIMMMMMRLV